MDDIETMDEEYLIELVKKYRVLYDPNHAQHSNRNMKYGLWAFIASHFKHNDARTTMEKWRILRDRYKGYLRINKKRGSVGKRAIKFKHAHAMRFLAKQYMMRDLQSNSFKKKNGFCIVEVRNPDEIRKLNAQLMNSIMNSMPSSSCNTADGELEDYDDEKEDLMNEFLFNVRNTVNVLPADLVTMAKGEVFRVVREYEKASGGDLRTPGITMFYNRVCNMHAFNDGAPRSNIFSGDGDMNKEDNEAG